MNELQKSLISFGSIIIAVILIYLGIHWYLKSHKKMKSHKMLTLNLVIKYKLFLEYLTHQDKKQQNYYLFLVKLNNLNILENTYSDQVIRNYLTYIVKELSVHLPFGGKIAQTNQRDTFIMYYPSMDEDIDLLGRQFKLLAQKTYHENGMHVAKTASVAMIDKFDLKALSNALVASVKHLGEPTMFDEILHQSSQEFMSIQDKLKQVDFKLKSYNVELLKIKKANEVYNDVYVHDMKLNDFLNKLPLADQSWINLMLVEFVLNKLYLENIYANISLPVLLVTMEQVQFVEYLQSLAIANQFSLENIILSLKLTSVQNEDQLIKNILTLSNLGVKISLQLETIDQGIYLAIQRYHVKRLELNDALMHHELIADLLYFAKVNHIEVLYKTTKTDVADEVSNISHITKDIIVFNQEKKKRGRN